MSQGDRRRTLTQMLLDIVDQLPPWRAQMMLFNLEELDQAPASVGDLADQGTAGS